jgi:hypothetical protein
MAAASATAMLVKHSLILLLDYKGYETSRGARRHKAGSAGPRFD